MAGKRRASMIDKLLSLRSVGNPQISPDGKLLAYTGQETDWAEDRFVGQIWIADVETRKRFQLTRGQKRAGGHQWSPDGKRLAFLCEREGSGESASAEEKGKKSEVADNQIWLISPSGGEAVRLTKSETSVSGFRWSPDGSQIAFHAPEPESKERKERKEKYGEIEIINEDITMSQLWIVDVRTKRSKQVVAEADRSVVSYDWSPDGKRLVLELIADPRPKGWGTNDLYLLDLADDEIKPLVVQPGPNSRPKWSPDGKQIAFRTAMGQEDFFYTNSQIAVVSADGGEPVSITDTFDESVSPMAWGPDGIYFQASQRMASHLFRADPESGEITRISAPDDYIGYSFSFTEDFKTVAFVSPDSKHLSEAFVSSVDRFRPRRMTTVNAQVRRLTFGTREAVQWSSSDGAEIEGVLYKPADFDPERKHPLLVIIHGGPTGTSQPVLDPLHYVYPVELWLAKGAVILSPNYRGSAGYGEDFRSLNVRNLGVGDMWDVLSGVDHLISQGFVDPDRMGAMGWSQGGYISAFLTTHTDRFKAISVGAGISNWMTYYVNTDIPPFTRQYLKATPWDDPEIYAKTSPMTSIRQAVTPTLIQHGENDKRVPIPNAYELRQGLEDQGVPVKMIVYKGFGHGISKPKALRAALEHNLEWFNKWIWGEEVSDS
ncbi:S9 family peptidase [Candidatus Poribacteria bacterium]